MTYKCEACGAIFEESKTYREAHGEVYDGCPHCARTFHEYKECPMCGEEADGSWSLCKECEDEIVAKVWEVFYGDGYPHGLDQFDFCELLQTKIIESV